MPGKKQPFALETYTDLLRSQTITEESPGFILKDFRTLLNFLQEEQVLAGGKNQLLQLKFLPALNDRLSHSTDLRLKRPVHKSYPYIHGLYLLLRVMAIVQIMPRGRNQVFELDEARLQAWNQLNPTEQYFALLEAWLIVANEAVLGEARSREIINQVALYWQLTEPTQKITNDLLQDGLERLPGLPHLALAELFGLLSIQPGKPKEGKGWQVKQVKKLPLGDALIPLTMNAFLNYPYPWNAEFNDPAMDEQDFPDEPPGFGLLKSALQPFFPELQTVWTPPSQVFQEGIYTFKVSLGSVWRRIASPAECSLEDLAYAILNSYGFDDDHLYEFSYKDQRGLLCQICHPACEEPPFTDEVRVGDVVLPPGQAMQFRYDFGDNWKFKVELESLAPSDPKMKQCKLLERHGKAPEQYPSYDGW
ncbi:MAG: plasmid pRiA4b ORF-3 family protein [Oculatellaceae cyanobacterium Prado106]|jgi:hypothetical protein|nr:plasmid pRiA4b ORF-3 family protein [Oculatellaceae cyanobacterium Prado106]